MEVPLADAASRLQVSRRRAQTLIDEGRLRARRLGSQWVVPLDDLRVVANTLQPGPGRPLSPAGAWALIDEFDDVEHSADELDRIRRRVRPRAMHRHWYVHPGLIAELRDDHRVVLGGRHAAAAVAPVDADPAVMDIYLRTSDEHDIIDAFAVDAGVIDGENVRVHIVDDAVWPFRGADRIVRPWVGWLDLADALDRAADTVLDRLIGGRNRG